MKDGGKPLIIVGDGEFAEIAYEYFTYDSPYQVVGFAVEPAFLTKSELYGLPVISFENIEQQFPPANHSAFVAITFTQLNRIRARLYRAAKAKGYAPASYVSSRAFVWRNVVIGENCFIFENNVIQHHSIIGNNVVLWCGNTIGHRSVVRDHCFISAHVVVASYCEIGESSFLGVNSTIADRVHIAADCIIGAGSVVVHNTEPQKVYKGPRVATPSSVSSLRMFKVKGL